MLSKPGFDLWANDYDQIVKVSEEKNTYPFAGYKKILNTIYNEAMQHQYSSVLDIGFGTGVLTKKLYDNGHTIDGIDFSSEMVSISQAKMPKANLLECDISEGLPDFVTENTYDSIISTYTLHHLTDEDKVALMKSLVKLLNPNGKLLIGDVAFETWEKHNICKENSIGYRDQEEFYFVYEELQPMLQDFCTFEFHPISHCGGVFILSR